MIDDVTRTRSAATAALVLLVAATWLVVAQPAAADVGTSFSVNDPTVFEGDSGTSNLVFTVTMSGAPLTSNAQVDFFTNNAGTADPPGDYDIVSLTLTFTPGGPTSQQVVVPVVGDPVHEADETVPVTLDDPVNAVVVGFGHAGTILNDDPIPSISLGDATTSEGGTLAFPITLSNRSQDTVTVDFATVAGSAAAGTDYVASTGTVVFQATFASQIAVVTLTDALVEGTEGLTVVLSDPVNGTIVDGTGVGTIQDVAPPPPSDPTDDDEDGDLPRGPGQPVTEVDVTTTTSTTATTAPVVASAGDPSTTSTTRAAVRTAAAPGGAALPRTGASTGSLALIGLLAILAGAVVRRRSVVRF